MKIQAEPLKRFVSQIFQAAGCNPPEHERVAHYLVESNLVGHDSHGVIRVSTYISFLRAGKVLANQQPRVVFENDCLAVLDGRFGFGQTIGEAAMKLGIAKSEKHGVSVIAVRDCGHLGRIGDWPLMCCRANKASLHFVNTSGLGLLVSPFGGIDRRLSANPIAVGVPVPNGRHILLDISTSSIAEGKIRVAFNKGVNVPDGCLIDSNGQPTNDPKVFYGNPPGVILPFGGHKGYGLGVIAELLAGALTGGGCSKPGVQELSNGLLSIIISPDILASDFAYGQEIEQFIEFVRSSRKVSPDAQILLPGEIEEQTKDKRLREGIELDQNTWNQIVETATSLGVSQP